MVKSSCVGLKMELETWQPIILRTKHARRIVQLIGCTNYGQRTVKLYYCVCKGLSDIFGVHACFFFGKDIANSLKIQPFRTINRGSSNISPPFLSIFNHI